MKRLVIILAFLLIIFFPTFSVIAQPTHIPHEDPLHAKNSPDLVALVLSYCKMFELIAIRQYPSGERLLKELEKANVPEELRNIIERYHNLCQQLLTTLDKIELLLDEASKLFANKKFNAAELKLKEAGAAIQDAQLVLKDIKAATNTLGNKLGIGGAPASSHLKQAYKRLEESLRRLEELIERLNQLRESVRDNSLALAVYHPTQLEVTAPKIAYPGVPFIIHGRVSTEMERTIRVLLDGTQLTEGTVLGGFSLEITPPPQTSTGKHRLTVAVSPKGDYLGATKSLMIDILKLSIQADIKTPALALTTNPIKVGGKVSHNLAPLQNAQISLTFGKSSVTTRSASDGSFTALIKLPQLSLPTAISTNPFFATTTPLELPLDLSLIGPQPLTINIEPGEPWYAPLQIKRWVFTINPLNIGLMMIAFLSLGVFGYKLGRTKIPEREEKKVIPPPKVREPPPITLPPKYQFSGIKGRILCAYMSGLETVERITATSMTAAITLREFLERATPQLASAAKPFSELTKLAEVALYSVHRLDEKVAKRAEELACIIKEELDSEAT
jgi:hypothetical protein